MLGCYNAPNSEITLIQGWNWYAGADPTQIGAGQYDFETTVLHELGHALGLGGSTDPTSPMYETLAAGVADRTVTTQDLNIPDPPDGADPADGGRVPFCIGTLGRDASVSAADVGSETIPGLGGLMPLATGGAGSSGQWSVVSGQWLSEPPIRPFGPPSPTGGEPNHEHPFLQLPTTFCLLLTGCPGQWLIARPALRPVPSRLS